MADFVDEKSAAPTVDVLNESTVGKTTSTTTTAAPTVRFSDEPEVIYPEEENKKVSAPVVENQRRISRRERRNRHKARDDEKNRLQENVEHIEKFAKSLTLRNLISEVERYAFEDLEELGIKEQISGVPNNGRVPFSPRSYCNDCVNRIATYFKDENVAKNILVNGVEHDNEEVYIKDVKKLASLFLGAQKLHFYDHVTMEAFNNNAMKRGGSTYGLPLSMACLADTVKNGSGNLYEKLAGKETLCAAFSTGLTMRCETSDLTASSENSFKTHKQLLEENVNLDKIRRDCSCLKSDEWLMKRDVVETKMKRLMQKNNRTNEKVMSWEKFMLNKSKWANSDNWGDDDVSVNWGDYDVSENWGDDDVSEKWGDDDVSSCVTDKEDKKNKPEEEKAEQHSEEGGEKEDEEDSGVIFEQPENEDDGLDEDDSTYSEEEEREDEEEDSDVEEVNDRDFRPGNLVQPVEKEEDFDNEHWSDMRCTSSCLALCRHAPFCVVDTINKERILESLMLVPLSENEKEAIASTTPGKYFAVIAHPKSSLIFSLGATVYEALARQYDYDGRRNGPLLKNTIAKAYTTVHTVAAPFFRAAPVCYIDARNKYGYYKTFRICIPGNFSGCHNDMSIGWRSDLYSRLTFSAAEAECRGKKKSHYSFLEKGPISIERGVVYDDSGDMSGNYLLYDYGMNNGKKTAAIAHAATRNMIAALQNLKESIGDLLTGLFKNQLVQLKTLDDIDRPQAENAAAAKGGMTAHETQRWNDIRTNMNQNAKFTAQTIERYQMCLKSMERDLGTMNKHLTYYLKDYEMVTASSVDIANDIFSYYL